jgi:hypothetical protein
LTRGSRQAIHRANQLHRFNEPLRSCLVKSKGQRIFECVNLA